MLARGEHPLGYVQQKVRKLAKGEFLLLVTDFKPEPLIDTIKKQGVAVYHQLEQEDKKHHTYIAHI